MIMWSFKSTALLWYVVVVEVSLFLSFFLPSLPWSPLQPKEGEYWVSGRTEDEALEKASKKFNIPKDKIKLEQGGMLGAQYSVLYLEIK